MYEEIKNKYEKLEKRLFDPEIGKNIEEMTKASKELSNLRELYFLILDLEKTEEKIKENKNIIETENDLELKQMASDELEQLKIEEGDIAKKIEKELYPDDPNDNKNAIIEIRGGTGGDESALFSAELFRMYSYFAEKNNWKVNILNSSHTGIGGFKEIIFEVIGKGAYGSFKYEAGTHRVQRVPETEKQGRIHTSTVTVVVLPEAEEIDIEIKNEDLRIDTYASSGPGGQSVNTTNSAVRILHLPSNTIVQCQDQKSQHQNKEKAMQILRSRLLAKAEEEKRLKETSERKQQVGSGERSDKVRTYNFPQDRVTDHRVKKTWHSISKIMEGDLDDLIKELKK